MDSELYDEFGNFLGNASDSDSESVDFQTANATTNGEVDSRAEVSHTDEVSLAQNAHGPGLQNTQSIATVDITEADPETEDVMANAETVMVDPTHDGVDEPVIRPQPSNLLLENSAQNDLPETTYSKEYLKQMASEMPQRTRNMAIIGALHCGKSTLVDSFIEETHPSLEPLRFLDTHKLETERGVTISSSTASLLLQDLKFRSNLCHIMDTPGHPDFHEERAASLHIADGVVFVVDVLEGLTFSAKKILTEAVQANLPIVVVLNKIDRLVLELRLPPGEFCAKIRSVLADINSHVYHNEFASGYTHETLFSPLKDNVVFASRVLGFSFTLQTWALLYGSKFDMDTSKLALLLWGDVSFANGRFSRSKSATSFQHLVVEPLYKLITHSLVFDQAKGTLASLLWDQFGISLPKDAHKLDPQVLLRTVFGALSQGSRDFVSSIVATFPGVDPDPESELVAEVAKLYDNSNCLVRIHKGRLNVGQKVCVLAENHCKTETIASISIPVGRYNIACDEAFQGQIVLISGPESIAKCATLVSPDSNNKTPVHMTRVGNKSVYKVAIEPEIPSDLPRLVRGLQRLSKSYISAVVKLEESGEHVVLGPGELYLDCFLHDLRHLDSEYLSIKVSDPLVRFSESCAETSVTRVPIATPNAKSEISIIAEPIGDKKLLAAIEQGKLKSSQPPKVMAKILKDDFAWDALAARSVWTFGPSDLQNPSILLDDSLEDETDKSALRHVKDSIVAGFHMGINEGPLCDEPIRRTKFKILDAVLDGALMKNAGQTIPMTRNAVHCGLMTAAPKLLEPMYKVYVTCTYNTISAVHTMLEKRRGWVIFEKEVPATKLFEIEGIVPVIDSPGLDTDMRLNTQGQAFCTLEFAKWNQVPGDPLDPDCYLPAMQPVPRSSLARDFVMKTRKRKGLSGEPTLQKYVGQALYTQMKQSGIIN